MSDFTYDLPNKESYFSTLQTYLASSENINHKLLNEAIIGGACDFKTSMSFSNQRWNAYSAEVHFYLKPDKLQSVSQIPKRIIIDDCNLIMPKNAGYDIVDVRFAPLLQEHAPSLTEYLQESIRNSPVENFNILPNDILQKGKDMTEVYNYLYYVENSLRIFIEQICIQAYGKDYFNNITLNRDITKAIERRISEEEKHKWMRVRGDSKIFYLDFIDISNLIINNWSLFSAFFPDQNWLSVKINDMARCRNYVAHNSYIDQLERDVLKTSFAQILRQISRNEVARPSSAF